VRSIQDWLQTPKSIDLSPTSTFQFYIKYNLLGTKGVDNTKIVLLFPLFPVSHFLPSLFLLLYEFSEKNYKKNWFWLHILKNYILYFESKQTSNTLRVVCSTVGFKLFYRSAFQIFGCCPLTSFYVNSLHWSAYRTDNYA